MNSTSLPTWSIETQQVLVIQPSLAALETVFSLLKNSFGNQQLTSLEDYVETSLMLQYNHHWSIFIVYVLCGFVNPMIIHFNFCHMNI